MHRQNTSCLQRKMRNTTINGNNTLAKYKQCAIDNAQVFKNAIIVELPYSSDLRGRGYSYIVFGF